MSILSDLFKRFYTNYFLDYWEIKYKLLKNRTENYNDFKEALTNIKNIETIKNYKKKFLTFLKFEVHSLKFQVIETLFSFIFALEKGDDSDLWFNLTFSQNSSERSFAVYDKISGFKRLWNLEEYLRTKIKLEKELIPYWKYVFFFDRDLSECGAETKIIEKNIITLLHQMAQTFSDREDYNAYKHALRCFSSSLSLSIKSENVKEFIPMSFAKDGMTFLTKSKNKDDIVINSTFKAFSLKEDFYYIYEAIKLLKNIITVRKPHFSEEEGGDEIYYCEEEKLYYVSDDYNLSKFSISTTSLNTILKQADYHYQQANFDTASISFQKILQIDNVNKNAILGLGYCLFNLRKFDESIKYFKKYTKNNLAEYWKRAQYHLALCYHAKNDLKSTEVELTKLINNYMGDNDSILTHARYFLADIKLKLNQQFFEEYGKNEGRYIKSTLKLLKKAEENSFEHPDIWFRLALVVSYLGRFEEAKEIYKKINLHFPDDISTKLNLAHLVIDSESELDYAENLLQECLELDQDNFNTWVGISVLKLKQGKNNDYYDACKKVLELASNPMEQKIANNNIGDFYRGNSNCKKALKYFRIALEIDETFNNSIGGYIECLWNLKMYEEIVEFTKDFKYSKLNKEHLKMRGYALSYINKHKDALKVIEKSIEIYKDNLKFLSDLYDSKGDLLVRIGNIKEALDYYQKSLDTGDKDYEFTSKTKEKIAKYKN